MFSRLLYSLTLLKADKNYFHSKRSIVCLLFSRYFQPSDWGKDVFFFFLLNWLHARMISYIEPCKRFLSLVDKKEKYGLSAV